ncbi:MAG: DHHA1 domain-containing protein, partial [Vicinamibacteria bacterium]
LHQLPRSREVFAGLSSYPMDFEVWSALEVETLAEEGTILLRYQKELVGLVCSSARMETLAGYRVPVVNAPLLGSEVGEELLKRFPEAPFVAIYFDRGDGKRQWSLRSREDFDVSVVARLFQNGGHRQAAGFEIDIGPEFMPKPKKLS